MRKSNKLLSAVLSLLIVGVILSFVDSIPTVTEPVIISTTTPTILQEETYLPYDIKPVVKQPIVKPSRTTIPKVDPIYESTFLQKDIEPTVVKEVSRDREDSHEEEIDIFAALIYAESGAEGEEGMFAVGQVVINRAKYYDMTITKTILERGVFSVVGSRKFKNRVYSKEAKSVARKLLNGYVFKKVGNSLFFVAKRAYRAGNWHYDYTGVTIDKVCTIGDVVFLKLMGEIFSPP